VRLSIVRGGGLAGVARRTEITTDALPEDAAQALEAQAAAVLPLAAPGDAPPTPARDELLYTVCVERADGTVEAHYTDSTLPEDVRALIAWADGRPERRDDLER
jgi:emfourin